MASGQESVTGKLKIRNKTVLFCLAESDMPLS
jgi:hypothetical protein